MNILLIWVDDVIIASNSASTLREVKEALGQMFRMKDLGRLSWFPSINFTFSTDSISMDQTEYIEKILNRFQMDGRKPRATTSELGVNEMVTENSDELADKKLY